MYFRLSISLNVGIMVGDGSSSSNGPESRENENFGNPRSEDKAEETNTNSERTEVTDSGGSPSVDDHISKTEDITTSSIDEDAPSTPPSSDDRERNRPPSKESDEVYCTSCGEPVKKEAVVCPHCGVAQNATSQSTGDLPEHRRYELQEIACKDIRTTMAIGFLLSPAGYWMVGKVGLAIINFLTFNYFFLGIVLVPLHVRNIIQEARDELERNGETW